MSTHLLNDIYNGTLNTISLTGYNGVKSVVIVSSWVLSPVKSLCYMIGVGHPAEPSPTPQNSLSPSPLPTNMHTNSNNSNNHNVITRYDLIDAAERKEREKQEKKKRKQRRKSTAEAEQ